MTAPTLGDRAAQAIPLTMTTSANPMCATGSSTLNAARTALRDARRSAS
ncbi:hypothetical protein ACFU6R_01030 [Streptomyces sp. NPDC057499]